MTALTVCSVVAALLYLMAGLVIVRSMKGPNAHAPVWVRWPVGAALLIHAFVLHDGMFRNGVTLFGFGYALSEMFFFAVVILLVETWIHRLHGQFGIVLLGAVVGVLSTIIFPGQVIESAEWTPIFRWHLFMAIAAYAFMLIAFVHGILMTIQNRRLKCPTPEVKSTGFLDSLPGLVVMERIFFRIVAVGFLCMTLTLFLGALATHEAYGVYFWLDHKTVLTWIAWGLFCVLLGGRYFAGWRAKTALNWFWAGCTVFAVAYFGYSFVIELMA